MKKLLPLLLSYVFLSTQAWALTGGPVFNTGDSTTTIGTFGGVLLPDGDESDTDGTGTPVTGGSVTLPEDNSLGVFSLGVPQTSVASGAFVYFTQGRTYVGAIIGIADPDRLSFQGLVKAQFNISINSAVLIDPDGDTTPINFNFPAGYANGSIDCAIVPGGFATGLGLATRIEGTASLSVQDADVDNGAPTGPISSLNLRVDGYKQSQTADVSADLESFGLSIGTTTGGTGGTGTQQ